MTSAKSLGIKLLYTLVMSIGTLIICSCGGDSRQDSVTKADDDWLLNAAFFQPPLKIGGSKLLRYGEKTGVRTGSIVTVSNGSRTVRLEIRGTPERDQFFITNHFDLIRAVCRNGIINIVNLTLQRVSVVSEDGRFVISPYQLKSVKEGKNLKVFVDQTKIFEGAVTAPNCTLSIWGDNSFFLDIRVF